MSEAKEFYEEYKAEGGKLSWKPFLQRLSAYAKQFPDRPKIKQEKREPTLLEIYDMLKMEARRIALKNAMEFYSKHPELLEEN